MIDNAVHSAMLINPARTIKGKVELYTGSTLSATYTGEDALSSFTVSRAGDKKFFGFGVCQELELKLIDKDRAIEITPEQSLKVYFGVDGDYISPTPDFYVVSVSRDENSNGLTIKAKDKIGKAAEHKFSELTLTAPYTVKNLAESIASFLGLRRVVFGPSSSLGLTLEMPDGANFDDGDTLRAVLDDIAEVIQSIYYIENDVLIFQRLITDSEPVLTITRDHYFTLQNKDVKTLVGVAKATELGDNVELTNGQEGEIQYIRDNGFWELREDIDDLLEDALNNVAGLTINQFECSWRGNYLLGIGDKIAIETKDNDTIESYLLFDSYTYNGGLKATTSWDFSETTVTANPTNLGDKINQTYARVNKLDQNITLYINDTNESISQLQLTAEEITASVTSNSENVGEALETLTNEVSTKMTEEEFTIAITTALADGVGKVVTSAKNYTFDDEGLNISSLNSEFDTSITENGMSIQRSGDEVLVADNEGVRAEDLHATTYLIIGENSRFEDWNGYTACFWIGG